MIRHNVRGWNTKSRASRHGSRISRGLRPWGLEGLEERVLLSATVFTVNSTGSGTQGTGLSGTLPYVVSQANRNPNPDGSIINFEPSLFNATTPGLIVLASGLELTNTTDPVTISGPGDGSTIIDGNFAVEPFNVADGVTATIQGVTIENGTSNDGGGISNNGNLTVKQTTINDCFAEGTTTTDGTRYGGLGAGIYNGGTLAVENCTLDNNDAPVLGQFTPSEGGGIYNASFGRGLTVTGTTFNSDQAAVGGGIENDLNLTPGGLPGLEVFNSNIVDCSDSGIYNSGEAYLSAANLTGNAVGMGGTNHGGGFDNLGNATLAGCLINLNSAEYGSGISNQGMLEIDSTTIAGNTATGASFGGGIYNNGVLTLSLSSMYDNQVDGQGGAIFNDGSGNIDMYDSLLASNYAGQGGGIFNNNTMSLVNSTIANNSAITAGGGIVVGDPMTILNCTIAYNTVTSDTITAGQAGGGLNIPNAAYAPTLNNTIVAQNTDDFGADDIVGQVSSSSAYNMIGTGGSGGLTKSHGNIVNITDPDLGALANNGGPTETILLLYGSPAVGTGSVALAVYPENPKETLDTDQRWTGFSRIINGKVNMGAVEDVPTKPGGQMQVNWGDRLSTILQTGPDGVTQLPAGRKTDLPWSNITSLQFDVNEPVDLTAADIMVQSARGINYGPITVSGSGMNYTLMFAQPIDKADRVTITVNIAGTEIFSGRLNVLPGDINDDGVVNSKDLTVLRKELRGKGSAQSLMFGDFLGDGKVTSVELAAAKKYLGTRLPKLPKVGGVHPKAILARALLRRPFDTKRV